ncbi:MAG: M1 family metallopeptidase [Bacteroidota bacterium]|nr:M1 family metallopeptidase [Bacteroidota bacterium]
MKLHFSVIFLVTLELSVSASDGYVRNPFIDVINYTFSVSVSDTNNVIYGKTTISLNFTGAAGEMDFDLKNLNSSGKGMIVDSVFFSRGRITWTHNENKLKIIPDSAMTGLSSGIVRIIYHGIPADGLIISNNKFGSRTFFSDNWPNRASNYLPCVDHPYDKATVDFIVQAPSHYEVVASGYLLEESHLNGNTKLWHWKEEVPLATKVMAFGAADFDILLAGKTGDVPVWTYVFRENRKEGFYDYVAGVRPVTFFTQLIGPYSYEKLANVQSKTIFGGLENAGCIFYAENSVTGKGRDESLMAHEIAHQWFGNSVTENDWYHIWLSEGFATYLASVYGEKYYGRERLMEDMRSARELVLKYYLKSQRPVIDTTITNLMRLLSPNSYQKGAWVLHMLRHEIGEEPFWAGMRLFYERFRNKNAVTSDFEKVMEEVSGKNLDDFFHQWLYVGGQPDLKITTKKGAKKGEAEITVEQKQAYLFKFPLELLIDSKEGTYSKNIRISERISKLTVQTAKLNEIVPDPDVNLLFRQVTE